MSTASTQRFNLTNMAFLLGTLAIALAGTPWYVVTRGLGWPEALTFCALWLAVGISVTAGYHRLFAHKSYQAVWPVRLFFLVFGAGALEDAIVDWAADHRVHHSHVDHDRDPYNIQKGFWWAHIGWIFVRYEPHPDTVVRDLLGDPLVRWQRRWYKVLAVAVAAGIPLAVGIATGRVLGCLLIGGVLRVVASHHTTFFINSFCHLIGRQPYSRGHSARDSAVMAVLAFGEGYHNYHHSFPFDYRNGIRGWQFDPAKWTIYALSRLGLARDLRRASDTAILKARIEVQFEAAQEKMERAIGEVRASCEARLHDAYRALQSALRELTALQRRPAAAAGHPGEPPEARLGLVHGTLEQALREWQKTLRQMNRLVAGASAPG
ncbi:MAG TPA: fatty acid desaturase [Thermoanaerobaculia bacterium]|nr:fatty acid desaturase [Thermoanaerobaculia bacterium]